MVSISAMEVKLTQKPVLQMQRLSTSMLDLFPCQNWVSVLPFRHRLFPTDVGTFQIRWPHHSVEWMHLQGWTAKVPEPSQYPGAVSEVFKWLGFLLCFVFYSLGNWTHGSVQASLGTDSVAQASSVALLPCHPWVSIITGLHDQARLLHCSYLLPTHPLKFILSHIADIRNIPGFT